MVITGKAGEAPAVVQPYGMAVIVELDIRFWAYLLAAAASQTGIGVDGERLVADKVFDEEMSQQTAVDTWPSA